jgi:tetratricopeptide (TPR) repeat protein
MILEDLPEKELSQIKNFYLNKKVLIIEEKKTSRGTIKRILTTFGVKVTNIDTVDNLSHAKEILSERKFDVVFCNSIFKEKDATFLVEDHVNKFPNRAKVLFVLISSPNSVAATCKILDSEIDDYIAEPFSSHSLTESLLKLTKRKMNNTKSYLEYHKAKSYLYLNDLENAELSIEELKKEKSYVDEALYLEGKLYCKHGDLETSLFFYEKVLKTNPKHYLSLKELINGYTQLKDFEKAYDYSKALLSVYPINPSNLPELIRLSLLNKKYEDLINYSKFFHSLEEKSPSIKTTIAASLVICGKFFFETDDRAQAIQTLLEAVKASSGKLSIIQNIVQILMNNEEVRIAYEVLMNFEPLHGHDISYQVLEIELCYLNNDSKTVLRKGLPLIQKGVIEKSLFTAVIKSSVKANRTEKNIQDLIDKANQHFPTSSDFFNSLFIK